MQVYVGATMKKIATHYILATGSSFNTAKKHVTDFFQRTELVRYDYISINEQKCASATSDDFYSILDRHLEKNKETLVKLVSDLEAAGINSITDLINLQQGYPSKVLHIATHFLDGFIGIDSIFYNLIDDSHWFPETTRSTIQTSPADFWLIHLDGYSHTPDKAGLVQH